MTQDPPDPEELLVQFNRLLRELLRGQINRTTFRPWEVELLLDVESCGLRDSSREGTLRRYQKAVQRRIGRGATTPMMLSEFLGRKP
jgi:hypothetical protein